MLPITDLNLVVAGIATFAATVGYTYTRRQTTSPCVLRGTRRTQRSHLTPRYH